MASVVAQVSLSIVLAVTGVASFFVVPQAGGNATDRLWLSLQFFQGRLRIFCVESEREGVRVSPLDPAPDLHIRLAEPDWPPLPAGLVGADVPRSPWSGRIGVGGVRQVPAFGARFRSPIPIAAGARRASPVLVSFIRLPVWLPCVVLLWSPVRAVVRGARERRRRHHNQCVNCGYNLTGLPSPTCPECGTPFEPRSRNADV